MLVVPYTVRGFGGWCNPRKMFSFLQTFNLENSISDTQTENCYINMNMPFFFLFSMSFSLNWQI